MDGIGRLSNDPQHGPSADCVSRKHKTRYSLNPPVEHHVGWIMDAREHRPRTHSTGSSLGTSPTLGSSCGSVPQALPAFHHPSHGLLRENHFTQQAYHKYHSRCLKGRSMRILNNKNLKLLLLVFNELFTPLDDLRGRVKRAIRSIYNLKVKESLRDKFKEFGIITAVSHFHHHHHQPINVPTVGAQAFPMDGIGKLGHDPPRGHSADWRVLTTAYAAGTNGLTCLPKHGGARDNNFLVTHPMTDLCESCLSSTIAAERANHLRHRAPKYVNLLPIC
ncbi:hypothetical protein evm_006833 [Chilo suppressalis]|nr:hypothetical protein evm_006833 [Chilo suppressalis]